MDELVESDGGEKLPVPLFLVKCGSRPACHPIRAEMRHGIDPEEPQRVPVILVTQDRAYHHDPKTDGINHHMVYEGGIALLLLFIAISSVCKQKSNTQWMNRINTIDRKGIMSRIRFAW